VAPSGERGGGEGALPDRVRARWNRRGWSRPGDRVVVACSGGLDSVALLHLLRFPLAGLELEIEAAHFDHAMRADSPEDASWVRDLAGEWEVPIHLSRARPPPTSEAQARRLRYAFLEEVRRLRGARWVVTAHHADDQVETILFRILRGTGIRGLRGIPAARRPGILRPLLPYPRADLEEYARTEGLSYREDPTNVSRKYRRNRLRLDVIPGLEEVHPGACEGILRLGRNAARAWAALDWLLGPVVEGLTLERGDDHLVMDRDRFLRQPTAVRWALARRVAREMGVSLGEAGTRATVEFMTSGPSGGRVDLPDGLVLSRDFGRLRFGRTGGARAGAGDKGGSGRSDEEPDSLSIPAPGAGEGTVKVGGRAFRVRWGPDRRERNTEGWCERFDPAKLRFPLELRGWRPGDRTRTSGGTRKLKKLFGELRIPREERWTLPLLVDGGGEVVWIPGRHLAAMEPGSEDWAIEVDHGR